MTERSRTYSWSDPMATASGMAGRSGLEFLHAMAAGELPLPPILHTMGIKVIAAEHGRVVFGLEPTEYHYNPIGSVHGGVFATLLDSAAGCAVHSTLDAGVGYTSIDLNVKFLSPMRAGSGVVTCTGTVTHPGRRVMLAEARIEDESGRPLATATSSCLVLR